MLLHDFEVHLGLEQIFLIPLSIFSPFSKRVKQKRQHQDIFELVLQSCQRMILLFLGTY